MLWATGAGSLNVVATNGCGNSAVRSDTVRMTCRDGEIEAVTRSDIIKYVFYALGRRFYLAFEVGCPIYGEIVAWENAWKGAGSTEINR